jgi:hypothetical protein
MGKVGRAYKCRCSGISVLITRCNPDLSHTLSIQTTFPFSLGIGTWLPKMFCNT